MRKGANLIARPVMLVDVPNALGESLHVSGSDICEGSDLWNDPRFGEGYDEAAFLGTPQQKARGSAPFRRTGAPLVGQ